MKKLAVLIISLVLLSIPTVTLAAPKNPVYTTIQQVQQMIADALSPIQSAIDTLTGRVTAVETELTAVDSDLDDLEDSLANQSLVISTLESSTNSSVLNLGSRIQGLNNRLTIVENTVNNGDFGLVNLEARADKLDTNRYRLIVHTEATWKGVPVSFYDADLRGVFHIPGFDVPVIGVHDSHDLITEQFLSPPATIPVDLYVHWQGITRHVTVNISIP